MDPKPLAKLLKPWFWCGLALVCGFWFCWWRCKGSAAPTIVWIVRHAEKGADPGNGDPPLAANGVIRAAELARMLEHCGVQAVYATPFQRTQQTVAPTASQAGVTPTIFPANDVASLVASIRSNDRGKVVLVAAHSNTAPQIVDELSGVVVPAIVDATEFDNLYEVVLPRCGKPRVQHLKYGAPSP